MLELNVIQITGEITINVDVSVKKNHACEKGYVWNPAKCNYENGKYLAKIMDKIICDDIIKIFHMHDFNEKI